MLAESSPRRAPVAADLFCREETAFEKMTRLPGRAVNFLRDFCDAPEQVVSKRLIAFDTVDQALPQIPLLCHSFVSIIS
jgi:hypothetical protein